MKISILCKDCGGITDINKYEGETTYTCEYCQKNRDIPLKYITLFEIEKRKIKNELSSIKSCNDVVKMIHKPISLNINLKSNYEEKQNYWKDVWFAIKFFGAIFTPIAIIIICFLCWLPSTLG